MDIKDQLEKNQDYVPNIHDFNDEETISRNSLATIFEVETAIKSFYKIPKDEELAQGLTNMLIDYISNFLSNRVPFNTIILEYLLELLESEHTQTRERASKSIIKLMIKNNKDIRKAVLSRFHPDISPALKEELDKLIECAFSPLYFGWGHLNPDEDL